MSLKYLLPIWKKETEKGVEAFRFALPLAYTLKQELLRGGESALEKRALAVSLGSQAWPTDVDMPRRLGNALGAACLLVACRSCITKGVDELEAVVYFATSEMTYENGMRPTLLAYFQSVGVWIYDNVRASSGGQKSMEEIVGSWVLATTLKRELGFPDKAFAFLIGHKICDACSMWGLERISPFGAQPMRQ
jgi:hypothetical protein